MGSVAVSSFSTHWQMPRGLHHKVEENIFGEPVHPLIKGKGPRKEDCIFFFWPHPHPFFLPKVRRCLGMQGTIPTTLKIKSPMLG